uniref:Senescence domain-containing protein n=1 Tax=Solanum lycopersicum TaxID=4081 RepID=A0A3Q7G0P7_SOLLC
MQLSLAQVLFFVYKLMTYFGRSLKQIFLLIGRICDAVEVAGKNLISTSGTMTTEFVSHRYGEEAAKATSEGLHALLVFFAEKAPQPSSFPSAQFCYCSC